MQRVARRVFVPCCAAVLAAASGNAAAQDVDFDFDHSCQADYLDWGAFYEAYYADPTDYSADINLDGVVDSADAALLENGVTSDTFASYWCVSTDLEGGSFPARHRMDTQVDLSATEFSRKCVIFYDHNVPNYPNDWYSQDGLYLIFTGNPAVIPAKWEPISNWLQNWQDWKVRLSSDIQYAVTQIVSSPSTFSGVCAIDFETLGPIWEYGVRPAGGTGGQYTQGEMWEFAVAAINNTWDGNFLFLVDYVPPVGTDGYDDLDPEDREAFLRLSYKYFGMDLFITTINEMRDIMPEAEIAWYGFPETDLADPSSSATLNDEMELLWPHLDVLAPVFYDPKESGQSAFDCVPDNSVIAGSNFYRDAMAEAKRVRDEYNEDARILPFVSFYYFLPGFEATPGCSQVPPLAWPHDIRQQVELPRAFGADGLILWGALLTTPVRTQVQSFVNQAGLWTGPINAVTCDIP